MNPTRIDTIDEQASAEPVDQHSPIREEDAAKQSVDGHQRRPILVDEVDDLVDFDDHSMSQASPP